MSEAHAPVESAAEEPDYFEVLVESMRELLVAKGLIGAGEVRAMVETLDAHDPTIGAALVARAWVDADFRARLLDDATAVVEQSGIDNYDHARFVVLEQTPDTHNLVVCTLCSCYPRALLGLPPDWYKSRPYRSRAVREPRAVLAEFGTARRRRRPDPGARQQREHALPRDADASRRHRRLDAGAARRPRHPGLDDRGQPRPDAVSGASAAGRSDAQRSAAA